LSQWSNDDTLSLGSRLSSEDGDDDFGSAAIWSGCGGFDQPRETKTQSRRASAVRAELEEQADRAN